MDRHHIPLRLLLAITTESCGLFMEPSAFELRRNPAADVAADGADASETTDARDENDPADAADVSEGLDVPDLLDVPGPPDVLDVISEPDAAAVHDVISEPDAAAVTCIAGEVRCGATCLPRASLTPLPLEPISGSIVTQRIVFRWGGASIAGSFRVEFEPVDGRSPLSVSVPGVGVMNTAMVTVPFPTNLRGSYRYRIVFSPLSCPAFTSSSERRTIHVRPRRIGDRVPGSVWGTVPDFDNDGGGDVLFGAFPDATVGFQTFFLGSARARSTPSMITGPIWPVGNISARSAGDVFGDGKFGVLVNNPRLTPTFASQLAEVEAPPTVVRAISASSLEAPFGIGDFNGDGIGDVISRPSSSLFVGLGTRTSTIVPVSLLTAGGAAPGSMARYAAVGDVTGDRLSDVVMLDLGAAILWEGQRVALSVGRSISGRALPIDPGALSSVANISGAGDINGDSIADLAVVSRTAVAHRLDFFSLVGGVLTPIPMTATLPTIAPVGVMGTVGDINGDGFDDFVTWQPITNALTVFMGAPSISRSGAVPGSYADVTSISALGDLDATVIGSTEAPCDDFAFAGRSASAVRPTVFIVRGGPTAGVPPTAAPYALPFAMRTFGPRVACSMESL